jgi:magnesium chelatase family protein
MVELRTKSQFRELNDLLKRNHSLNGGILCGLDGYVIEVQASAISVLDEARPWRRCTAISGLATDAAKEVLQRITGAFAKLGVPDPEVQVLTNLAPAVTTYSANLTMNSFLAH